MARHLAKASRPHGGASRRTKRRKHAAIRTPGAHAAGRHASKARPHHASTRRPSWPLLLLGFGSLAVAASGALNTSTYLRSSSESLATATASSPKPSTVTSGGTSSIASFGRSGRRSTLSRAGADRTMEARIGRNDDRNDDRNGAQGRAAVQQRADDRLAALERIARMADAEAERLRADQWVLPLAQVRITATYGEYGLWSSYHTGLDFDGNSGDPIAAIASGVITSTGYDGPYGNKTVLTLGDGTEIWFCHQTSILVSPGDRVGAGQTIGTVGATGNVTGSHLHVEVRPGGGDPVDPAAAFAAHGVDI